MSNGVFHPPSHYLGRLKGYEQIGTGGQVILGILGTLLHFVTSGLNDLLRGYQKYRCQADIEGDNYEKI